MATKTVRVKILRTTVADRRRVEVGEVTEISEADARLLVRMGKAKETTAKLTTKAESPAENDKP